MKIRYSVIIPIYNAENTIRRCLDSLLTKRRRDVEIILVDDGSKDSSGQICKEYANAYESIKYIYQENRGVSSARNKGIRVSSGEFILFVDSDDFVDERYFVVIDSTLNEYKYDYIIFSRILIKGTVQTRRILSYFEAKNRADVFPHIIDSICRKYINGPVTKVYRAGLIKNNDIWFPENVSVAEDRAFNIKYSLYINSMCILSDPLYYVYLDNENSLSRKQTVDLKQQFLIADRYLEEAVGSAPLSEEEKGKYIEAFNFGDCRSVYKDAKDMHRLHLPWLERIHRIGILCDQINKKCMKYPDNRFCKLVTLPVRWRLILVIDAMAWKLVH